jgi:hypothetical protein
MYTGPTVGATQVVELRLDQVYIEIGSISHANWKEKMTMY